MTVETTHEREITEPIDLCLPSGRLDPAAIGWTRTPLHRREPARLGQDEAVGVLVRPDPGRSCWR